MHHHHTARHLALLATLLLPRLTAQQSTILPPAQATPPVVMANGLAGADTPDVPMPPKALLHRANVAWTPVPDGPLRPGQPASPELQVDPAPGSGVLAAPGDFRVFLNTQGGTGGSPADPATSAHGDTVLYTGNTYARLSTNGGQTFAPLNPFTLFPNSDGGLCCDQKLLHVPALDVTVWLLEYFSSATTGRGRQRIAIARGAAGVRNSAWTFFDIDPQRFGFGANLGLDYADIAATSTTLYGSSLVINTNSAVGLVLWRLNLADLLAGRPAPIVFYTDSQIGGVGGYRFAQDRGGSDVLWAAHQSTSVLNVYRWSDFDSAATRTQLSVSSWSSAPTPAAGPDGRDWTGFRFTTNCVLAGYANGGEAGFLWSSGAHGARPQQYIRVARVSRSAAPTLIAEHDLWNATQGFHFPSACSNARGHVGGTFAFGGGGSFPSMGAFLVDDFSSWNSISTTTVRSGGSGPGANRWGDYQVTARHPTFANTWVGSGFALDNLGNGDHRFVWFGRERDLPGVSVAVTANLAVGAAVTAPVDLDGLGNGTTNFTRRYGAAQTVTLTAPRLASGWKVFDRWSVDGVAQPLDQLSVSVATSVGPSHTAHASYVDGEVISVSASETGVPITVGATDTQGLGNGTGSFLRCYKPTRLVTFTAPAAWNGRAFHHWDSTLTTDPPVGAQSITVDRTTSIRAWYGNYTAPGYRDIGAGCAGQNGVLTQEVSPGTAAEIGRTITWRCFNAPPFVPAWANLAATSNTLISRIFGTNCWVYVSGGTTTALTTNAIGLSWISYPIPNDPALIGTRVYTQFFVDENPANPFAGTLSSNAMETTIGGYR